jgi:hypothetical protein
MVVPSHSFAGLETGTESDATAEPETGRRPKGETAAREFPLMETGKSG